ncbi:MAG TPA: hypothetical protein VM286_08980 [Candidatus Thermoplasmatota archaeon]|nr:hypothetical protein [Candidatus Thermoplasmatota archaeon]
MELTGLLSGTGAKMKGDIGEDHVTFRGAFKADVPFEEIVAEARGTLLVLSCRGHTIELGAGAKAGALAARIRSPPGRLDRLGVQPGMTAAVAGAIDPAFKAELGSRAVVAPGAPRQPVDLLVFGVASAAQLEPLPKLGALVAPGGSLWVVCAKGKAPTEAQVAAAARLAGLDARGSARFSADLVALRFARPAG